MVGTAPPPGPVSEPGTGSADPDTGDGGAKVGGADKPAEGANAEGANDGG